MRVKKKKGIRESKTLTDLWVILMKPERTPASKKTHNTMAHDISIELP